MSINTNFDSNGFTQSRPCSTVKSDLRKDLTDGKFKISNTTDNANLKNLIKYRSSNYSFKTYVYSSDRNSSNRILYNWATEEVTGFKINGSNIGIAATRSVSVPIKNADSSKLPFESKKVVTSTTYFKYDSGKIKWSTNASSWENLFDSDKTNMFVLMCGGGEAGGDGSWYAVTSDGASGGDGGSGALCYADMSKLGQIKVTIGSGGSGGNWADGGDTVVYRLNSGEYQEIARAYGGGKDSKFTRTANTNYEYFVPLTVIGGGGGGSSGANSGSVLGIPCGFKSGSSGSSAENRTLDSGILTSNPASKTDSRGNGSGYNSYKGSSYTSSGGGGGGSLLSPDYGTGGQGGGATTVTSETGKNGQSGAFIVLNSAI